VWGNLSGCLISGDSQDPVISRSCIEGGWPGDGTVDGDPLFCGWGSRSEVHVDRRATGPGDGSPESPFGDLARALEYDLSIAAGSPCAGSGPDGANMGDDLGTCEEPGAPARMVRIAPGAYSIRGSSLASGASLAGTDRAATFIEGDVFGLRPDAALSDLTVRGAEVGVSMTGKGSPAIRRIAVEGNRHGGIYCLLSSPVIEDCEIFGNSFAGVRCVGASPSLTNCAIWGNLAGVKCESKSSPAFVNCTIMGNLSSSGTLPGGVSCDAGSSPTLLNSIVWYNAPFGACGTLTRCLETEDPLFVSEGTFNVENSKEAEVDGLILEVPDFIVEPPDLRLEEGSPAIDTCPSAGAPKFDIDGRQRPIGNGVDMGAWENDGPPARRFIRGDLNRDGSQDLSDPVYSLLYQFSGGQPPDCEKSADVDDDGDIDISDPIVSLEYLFLGGARPPAPLFACGNDVTPDDLSCDFFDLCN